jgi:hypothetical protein
VSVGSPHAQLHSRFGGDDRPLGVDDVETAVFDGEVVVFHESRLMVHRLNSTAGMVWLLCDGDTSVDEMAVEIGDVLDLDPDGLYEGIYQALDQIADVGLLEGIDPLPRRQVSSRTEMLAPDGSRLLVAPPDP